MMTISVAVITYNSSKTILDTLESIKNQTLRNFELVISDDCSQDDTVKLCESWLEGHKDRFVSTRLITADSNTGIPANCNRAYRVCSSDWIKVIAGDDILLPDCLKENADFVAKYPDCKILHSDAISFKYFLGDLENQEEWRPVFMLSNNRNSTLQHKYLIYRNFIVAGTIFMSKYLYDISGGFDEGFKQGEDYPMWLKITSLGHYIYYLNKATIGYRINSEGVMNKYKNEGEYFNYHGFKSKYEMKKKYAFPSLSPFGRLLFKSEFIILTFIQKLRLNNCNQFSMKLFHLVHTMPKQYTLKKIKKISS